MEASFYYKKEHPEEKNLQTSFKNHIEKADLLHA